MGVNIFLAFKRTSFLGVHTLPQNLAALSIFRKAMVICPHPLKSLLDSKIEY
jgi:hypothetical protein